MFKPNDKVMVYGKVVEVITHKDGVDYVIAPDCDGVSFSFMRVRGDLVRISDDEVIRSLANER